MMKKYFLFTIAIFLILAFTVTFHSASYSSDDVVNPTPDSDVPAVEPARRGPKPVSRLLRELYIEPIEIYLLMTKGLTSEDGQKFFVEFIEEVYSAILGLRYSSDVLREYLLRYEEQANPAYLGLSGRKLTDWDVRRFFYTEEALTVHYLLSGRGRRDARSDEQRKQDRWEARRITLQYWGIPENTPADQWKKHVEYLEQKAYDKHVSHSISHVAMLCFISFFLNDDGATDDAIYYCMVALTRNHQEMSAALENAIFMIESPIRQPKNHEASTSILGFRKWTEGNWRIVEHMEQDRNLILRLRIEDWHKKRIEMMQQNMGGLQDESSR